MTGTAPTAAAASPVPLPEPQEIHAGDRRVTIRPARSRDAQGWIDLLTEVSREDRFILLESVTTTRREMARAFRFTCWAPDSAALIADCAGRVVGQLTATRNRNIYYHIAELGMSVDSNFRGEGVGRVLMDGAKDWARAFGVEKLVLNVLPDNLRAIRFYQKAGFEKEGHRRGHAKLSYGYEDLLEMGHWV
ncbi:MAG: GNAT family N-acetyltransferase [Actinomycetota bacterium]